MGAGVRLAAAFWLGGIAERSGRPHDFRAEDDSCLKLKKDINDYLTEVERKKLLASLHHVLVWVGVKEPEQMQIDGNDLKSEMEKFHQTEKEITEKERLQIAELIEILEKKEKIDEEDFKAAKLTQKQAIELHDEAASIIRALLDLNEAKKWNKFMDEIKKDDG
jgi:hypothetical protein